MSDFNRNNDLYRRDDLNHRDVPVTREKDSGLGMMAGIAVIVLLLLGGLLFYFNPGVIQTADNSAPTASNSSPAPITVPQRSPITPSTPSGSAASPADAPDSTTPPAAPAQ